MEMLAGINTAKANRVLSPCQIRYLDGACLLLLTKGLCTYCPFCEIADMFRECPK